MYKIIHWFRKDLRLHDNPALYSALSMGDVLPIFIFDTHNAKQYQIGSAAKVWLHYSLLNLQKTLQGKLYIFHGNPKDILLYLIQKYKICSVYWNRSYEPEEIKRDNAIVEEFKNINIVVKTFNASLLYEPWEIKKENGEPYRIFTSFYNKIFATSPPPRAPFLKPKITNNIIVIQENNDITSLNLLPKHNWYQKIKKHWSIGEESAKNKLDLFIREKLTDYKDERNYPSKNSVSFLSPHIHWGEISPFYIWNKVYSLDNKENVYCFLKEIIWREFSYHLLYNFPIITEKNLQKKFDIFPWEKNTKYILAWKKGVTGYPLVDAGMKQLLEEGYIHNRVRMIVASFLVKNLLIHWQEGARWFLDCLVDADLANNSANWQWVAGSGVDSSPYFRIFNPVTQSIKFDAEGSYIKKYIPALKNLPSKYIHSPWKTHKSILKTSGIILGENYPFPLVDLQESRKIAMQSYNQIKSFHHLD